MTDFELKWSDKSIKEYVDLSVTAGGVGKLSIALYIICFAVMPIAAVVVFFLTNQPIALVLGGCALLFGVGISLTMRFTVKSLTDKLSEAYKEQTGIICSVSDNNIVLSRNNRPINIIDWDKVSSLMSGKTALFITTSDNLMLMLERDAVLSGELRETEELFEIKRKNIKKS